MIPTAFSSARRGSGGSPRRSTGCCWRSRTSSCCTSPGHRQAEDGGGDRLVRRPVHRSQLPGGLADFLVTGWLRWSAPRLPPTWGRSTDQYPPFASMADAPINRCGCPPRPERLNRLAVLFRLILAVQPELLLALVGILAPASVMPGMAVIWLIVLVTGTIAGRRRAEAVAAVVRLRRPVLRLLLPDERHLPGRAVRRPGGLLWRIGPQACRTLGHLPWRAAGSRGGRCRPAPQPGRPEAPHGRGGRSWTPAQPGNGQPGNGPPGEAVAGGRRAGGRWAARGSRPPGDRQPGTGRPGTGRHFPRGELAHGSAGLAPGAVQPGPGGWSGLFIVLAGSVVLGRAPRRRREPGRRVPCGPAPRGWTPHQRHPRGAQRSSSGQAERALSQQR